MRQLISTACSEICKYNVLEIQRLSNRAKENDEITSNSQLNSFNPTKAPYIVYMLVSVICSIFVGGLFLILAWFIVSPLREILVSFNISPNVVFGILVVYILVVLFMGEKINKRLIMYVCSLFY